MPDLLNVVAGTGGFSFPAAAAMPTEIKLPLIGLAATRTSPAGTLGFSTAERFYKLPATGDIPLVKHPDDREHQRRQLASRSAQVVPLNHCTYMMGCQIVLQKLRLYPVSGLVELFHVRGGFARY